MIPYLESLIKDAIEEAKNQPKTRESSLVLTKLEEALMWFQKK